MLCCAHWRVYIHSIFGYSAYFWAASHPYISWILRSKWLPMTCNSFEKFSSVPYQFYRCCMLPYFVMTAYIRVFFSLYGYSVYVMFHLSLVSFSAPKNPTSKKKTLPYKERKGKKHTATNNNNKIASLLNLNGYLPISLLSLFPFSVWSHGIRNMDASQAKTRFSSVFFIFMKEKEIEKNNNANIKYLLMAANIFGVRFVFISYHFASVQCVLRSVKR